MPASIIIPELPRIAATVQLPTALPPAAESELCAFCGEPGLHQHPLDVYRVTFDDTAIIIRVPLGLNERERGTWAWEELGGLFPRPRFVSIEYLCGGWSDDLARGKSEVERHREIQEAA